MTERLLLAAFLAMALPAAPQPSMACHPITADWIYGRDLVAAAPSFAGLPPELAVSHSPVPGLVHRYPDRVLFLVTDRCASYCRYCTRSRLVSNATGYDFHPEFARQIEYIRKGARFLTTNSEIAFILAEGTRVTTELRRALA